MNDVRDISSRDASPTDSRGAVVVAADAEFVDLLTACRELLHDLPASKHGRTENWYATAADVVNRIDRFMITLAAEVHASGPPPLPPSPSSTDLAPQRSRRTRLRRST